jgi:peptidyl-prolyl cis-trans isomerase SurA
VEEKLLKRILAAVAAVCLTITAGMAVEGEAIDRIAAIVDNEIILESELYQYLQYNAGSQEALSRLSQAQADSLKKLILEDLIDQKVLLAKAREDTLQVEAKDIDRELDARLKTLVQQAGGQDRLEQYYGMPLAKLKREFRPLVEQSLLIDKLKQEKLHMVQVTPSDVQKFWETYKDSIPPLKDAMRIAHVLLPDQLSETSRQGTIQKADSVRALITSGAVTFEEYASKYSDDPASKSRGGKLGQTNRGDLVPEYESAAYALETGQISQPVVSPFGVHLIRVDERTGEKITTSHILFHILPTSADTLATWQRADSIIVAVRGGADWDKLVKKYTADTKTADKGGDLSWFAPEELPEEFKAPLADLKAGQVTEPVRTQFGLHVVRLSDRQFARPVTLADDPERIQRMTLAKKQDEVFKKWVQELRKKTYVEIKA